MNSVRKGCFKCGNLGHHADSCTATERLCYNCRQPGHQSSACPSPRSASAKQCYSCGGVGHIQVDCPTLRIQSMNAGGAQKCYHCGRPGHISRFCPAAAGGTLGARIGPRAPPPGSTPVKCFRCGGLNHYSRDCMAPAGTVVEGQQVVQTTVSSNNKSKTCYKCQQEGHIARECPQVTDGAY